MSQTRTTKPDNVESTAEIPPEVVGETVAPTVPVQPSPAPVTAPIENPKSEPTRPPLINTPSFRKSSATISKAQLNGKKLPTYLFYLNYHLSRLHLLDKL